MSKQRLQHRHEEEENNRVESSLSQDTNVEQEFNSPEELIREDAKRTTLPDSLTDRVGKSTAAEAAQPGFKIRRWLRRALGSED